MNRCSAVFMGLSILALATATSGCAAATGEASDEPEVATGAASSSSSTTTLSCTWDDVPRILFDRDKLAGSYTLTLGTRDGEGVGSGRRDALTFLLERDQTSIYQDKRPVLSEEVTGSSWSIVRTFVVPDKVLEGSAGKVMLKHFVRSGLRLLELEDRLPEAKRVEELADSRNAAISRAAKVATSEATLNCKKALEPTSR